MVMEYLGIVRAGYQALTWASRTLDKSVSLEEMRVDVATALDEVGEGTLVVTSEQNRDIEAFLRDPAVTRLLQLNLIAQLAPEPDARKLMQVAGRATFERLADTWCSNANTDTPWRDLADSLWEVVVLHQSALLHRAHTLLTDASRDEIVQRFFFGSVTTRKTPEYVRILGDLAQSNGRLSRLSQFVDDFKERRSQEDDSSFLVQGIEDERAAFDQLYIDRHLLDGSTGRLVNAVDVLNVSAVNPRVLVIGDPGVGKITLLSWVRWRLLADGRDGVSPIPVNIVCRHQLSRAGSSLYMAMRQEIAAAMQADVDDGVVDDLAATGWMVLIVDGVDEILDPERRRTIVNQLHAFAQRFPLVSIVATTRRKGFEVGLFGGKNFRVLSLEEYSEDQVSEYAQKWFGRYTKDLRADRFIGESRGLDDLRKNPLMLALLCTLFRQYDFIPRSRRDVYLRCAQLMFHEWDPRRGIDIPNVFKSEGEVILRDVALMLHRSGGVGESLEEGQLTQLISQYLQDQGEEPMSAGVAARDLLTYCSGRAWILTKVGSLGAVSRYSFTHRTFYEFFASEALIRRLNFSNQTHGRDSVGQVRLTPVAQLIVDAYRADSSSVLPELLLQTANDLMGGVSTAILADIQRDAARFKGNTGSSLTTLAVRLIASTGTNAIVADRVFAAMLEDWVTPSSSIDMTQYRAVLDVAAGHRGRLVERIKEEPSASISFLRRYARLVIMGEAGLFADEWRLAARAMAETDVDRLLLEPVLAWFGVKEALLSIDEAMAATSGADLLRIRFDGYEVPGLLWLSMCDSSDQELRAESWRVALKSLVRTGELEAASGASALDCLEVAEGVKSTTFDDELAMCLAFIMGPEGDARLVEVTGAARAVAFAAVVRGARLKVELASQARAAQGSALLQQASTPTLRRELNRAFKGVRDAPCPEWVKDWVGVGRVRTKRRS